MEQEKHSNSDFLDAEEIEISDVMFLTPARIKSKIDGQSCDFNVDVDIINRKVYFQNKIFKFSDKVFKYLDKINTLSSDFFKEDDSYFDEAIKAQKEHDSIKESMKNVQ